MWTTRQVFCVRKLDDNTRAEGLMTPRSPKLFFLLSFTSRGCEWNAMFVQKGWRVSRWAGGKHCLTPTLSTSADWREPIPWLIRLIVEKNNREEFRKVSLAWEYAWSAIAIFTTVNNGSACKTFPKGNARIIGSSGSSAFWCSFLIAHCANATFFREEIKLIWLDAGRRRWRQTSKQASKQKRDTKTVVIN